MNTKSDGADLELAGGSVVGGEHRRLDRGCQDAFAWRRGAQVVVAAVCDGCGSGRRSEVGAALGARLWCAELEALVAAGASLDDDATWLAARDAVLGHLGVLAGAMGGDLAATISEHFLFTSVVAAVTADHAAVFAIGDGVFALDGDVTVLGPFPGNQPPYLAYGLVGATPAPTALVVRPAATVTSILIGTDGAAELAERATDVVATGEPAGGLDQFWTADRFFTNPDAVRRRLAVINQDAVTVDADRGVVVRRAGLLADDTTVVAIRRAPPWRRAS